MKNRKTALRILMDAKTGSEFPWGYRRNDTRRHLYVLTLNGRAVRICNGLSASADDIHIFCELDNIPRCAKCESEVAKLGRECSAKREAKP